MNQVGKETTNPHTVVIDKKENQNKTKLIVEPKRRGRKPGSKNKPKGKLASNAEAGTSNKSQDGLGTKMTSSYVNKKHDGASTEKTGMPQSSEENLDRKQRDVPQEHEATAQQEEKGENTSIGDAVLIAETVTREAATPATYKEAMNDKDRVHHWKEACKAESKRKKNFGVYKLETTPENRQHISTRWVFCEKRDENGMLIRYKARWVVKGFMQAPGID